MKAFYSLLILLALSFSAMGENNYYSDTVKTSIISAPGFSDLLGRAIEENNVYVLSSAIPDSVMVVLQYKDKTGCPFTIDQKVSRENFLDSFQDLLYSYSKGQAELEKGFREGFSIFVLKLSRFDLDTSTLIFLVKEGKVIEIYFF